MILGITSVNAHSLISLCFILYFYYFVFFIRSDKTIFRDCFLNLHVKLRCQDHSTMIVFPIFQSYNNTLISYYFIK